jgi:chromosome segregation ATPase
MDPEKETREALEVESGAEKETLEVDSSAEGSKSTQDTPKGEAKEEKTESVDDLKREIEKLRRENAKHRTEGKTKAERLEELRKSVNKALGVDEKEEVDPKKLESELNDLKTKYRTERLKGAFAKAARSADVDEDIAFALMTINGDLDDLDVDDKSLKSEIELRLKALAEKNPRVKLGTGDKKEEKKSPPKEVPPSSVEIKGGSQETPITRETLKKMTPAEINKNFDRIAKLLEQNKL